MKVLFVYPNEMMLNPPPVSIGLFTALLRREGIELDLFDTTWYPTFSLSSDKAKEQNLQVRPFDFEERGLALRQTDLLTDLKSRVMEFSPDLILISILEPTYEQSCLILNALVPFGIPVLAGGTFCTFSPEMVLEHPAVDYVCIGEGEEAVVEFCRAFQSAKSLRSIDNIWARCSDGSVVKNPIRSPTCLEQLPVPDYSLFPPERFYRPMAGRVYLTVPVETNRGCPYHCSYCNSPSNAFMYRSQTGARYFRKKAVKQIAQEIDSLVRAWSPEYIYFPSDTFLIMTDEEFDEFTEYYSSCRLPFWMQTRAETVTEERMMRLGEIGCHRMSMGVEHGNEQFRREVLNKGISNKQIVAASQYIANAGIPLTANNIIGFPGETRSLVFDTIRLNRELELDSANAYAFIPFRGTPLYDSCLKAGLVKPDRFARNTTISTVLDLPDLSRAEIDGLRRTFALYVGMPESEWSRIQIAEGEGEDARVMFRELREEFLRSHWS